ncbi:hypothetical protein JCM10449v2_003579 [Rhodotorula kratochvilovae]
MTTEYDEKCLVCGEKTKNRCSSCVKAGIDLYFCSPEHQKLARMEDAPPADDAIKELHTTATGPEKDTLPKRRRSLAGALQHYCKVSHAEAPTVLRALSRDDSSPEVPPPLRQHVLALVRAMSMMRRNPLQSAIARSPPDPFESTAGMDFWAATTGENSIEYGTEPWRTRYRHILLIYTTVQALAIQGNVSPENANAWVAAIRRTLLAFIRDEMAKTSPNTARKLLSQYATSIYADKLRSEGRMFEGAGSFVRPDAKGLDVKGKTFEEALRGKYLDDDDECAPPSSSPGSSEPEDVVSTTRRFSTSGNFDVEVVLTSKVREHFHQLGRLREVGLEWEGVSCATRWYEDDAAQERPEGELKELGDSLSKLETLNLSFSLLPTLQEAERIAGVLPRLQNLSLNSNRFSRIDTPTALPGFERLRRLEINNTLMTWTEVRLISPSLPNLEELQFGYNRLSSLRASPTPSTSMRERRAILPKLNRLNLEANELSDWANLVEELSCLPNLKELVLADNRLASLDLPASFSPARSPDDPAASPSLPLLRHLSLSENCLSAWSTSIDALAASATSTFPSLSSLRLAGNPLLEPDRSAHTDATSPDVRLNRDDPFAPSTHPLDRAAVHTRLLLIARLPFLTELEGSPITPAERDDAERFWLEQLAKEQGAGSSDWAKERARALREKHGGIEAAATAGNAEVLGGKTKPTTLKTRLIHLHIRPPPSLRTTTDTPPTLSVLPTLRTLLLRTQLARLLASPLPKTKYRLVAVLQPAQGEKGETYTSEHSTRDAAATVTDGFITPPLDSLVAPVLVDSFSSTLSASLDETQEAGLGEGAVLELLGPPGIGKTRTSLGFVLAERFREDGGEVLVVDAEGSLVPALIKETAELYGEHHGYDAASVRAVLEGIRYRRIDSAWMLIAFFNSLESWLVQHPKVNLIIVDSLSSHLRPTLDSSTRTLIADAVRASLSAVCSTGRVSIILTTQLSLKLFGPDHRPSKWSRDAEALLVPHITERWIPQEVDAWRVLQYYDEQGERCVGRSPFVCNAPFAPHFER